ncbi:hypothetical protein H920_17017 [Fukomys damarensis]|uniref:Uncharacterized protein n=1 Tax=Fukomys damarensis TaxID=885580 RepID=A0A091CT68_FUKDA|nr:hypothetical protein H920_17017 [Fukomys damarensis]
MSYYYGNYYGGLGYGLGGFSGLGYGYGSSYGLGGFGGFSLDPQAELTTSATMSSPYRGLGYGYGSFGVLRLRLWRWQLRQTGLGQGLWIQLWLWKLCLWVCKHPSTLTGTHTRLEQGTKLTTSDTMSYYSSYYGGLGYGYGGFGAWGYGCGCGCGSLGRLGWGRGYGSYGDY